MNFRPLLPREFALTIRQIYF